MVEQQTLTAADRCDRCGAQAYAKSVHGEDGAAFALLWCAHHLKEASPKIIPSLVLDQTHLLAPPLPERVTS